MCASSQAQFAFTHAADGVDTRPATLVIASACVWHTVILIRTYSIRQTGCKSCQTVPQASMTQC